MIFFFDYFILVKPYFLSDLKIPNLQYHKYKNEQIFKTVYLKYDKYV
jgi:hypothetical protein